MRSASTSGCSRSPISGVRSPTTTSMMFITPTAPTSSVIRPADTRKIRNPRNRVCTIWSTSCTLKKLTAALRPWTIDFHVAQNNATVHGSGSHDKTGRHCPVNDPTGKLDIPHAAGFWLRDEAGQPTKAVKHICWDGCMFPNATMMKQQTWNDILGAMIKVRDRHGWNA